MIIIEWRNNRNHINRRHARAHYAYTKLHKGGPWLDRQWWYEFDHKRRCIRRQEQALATGHRYPFCLA